MVKGDKLISDCTYQYCHLISACFEYGEEYLLPNITEIKAAVKTGFKNFQVLLSKGDYNKILKTRIRKWNDRNVAELLQCIPSGIVAKHSS